MKTNLWLIIVVIVGFIGFLVGYSQSPSEVQSPAAGLVQKQTMMRQVTNKGTLLNEVVGNLP